MNAKSETLYIDLLKKVLTFALWDEPMTPITTYSFNRPFVVRILISAISKLLDSMNLQLVKNLNISKDDRMEGRIWPGLAHTMVGQKRLENLQFCIETVLEDGIEGDFIETGVWRGGSCIFMRGVLSVYGITNRRVYVADSFQGLPKPDNENYPEDKGVKFDKIKYLSISEAEVKNNFQKYGLLDDQVVFLKGWFNETLPKAPIQKLSIMRLDGDMYGSTMDALTNLYPKLSPGGFCIIDDYEMNICRKAVDDYRENNDIHEQIQKIDWTGIYWRKRS